MEQNILPKKIKIAIFLMLIIGVLTLIQFIFLIGITIQLEYPQYSISFTILKSLEILLLGILFIVFACFLKKKKKWAWFAAMVILLKEIVAGIKVTPLLFTAQTELEYLMVYLPPLISTFSLITRGIVLLGYIFVLISLIFLISERKNYWQIAS